MNKGARQKGIQIADKVRKFWRNFSQNYKAIIFPMTPIKFFALTTTVGIFAISADSWARTFGDFIFAEAFGIAFVSSSMTFFAIQALEILPLMMSYGHNSVGELAAAMGQAEYDPVAKTFLREQDVIEEYRVNEQQLTAATRIQAGAFALDLVVNWIAWGSPISGLDLAIQSGVASAVSIQWFPLTMVVLTVFGIPYILSLSIREAQRTEYFLAKVKGGK